jgi:predicted acyltransferase
MLSSALNPKGRIRSLDFFRGITMFLLIGEFTGLYAYFIFPEFKGTIMYFIGNQLHHPEWEGVSFWDAIHPFFVFPDFDNAPP